MKSRCAFSILSCLVYLCHYTFTLQWAGNHLNSNSYKEFRVTGEDLKDCDDQRNVCVTKSEDCGSSVLLHEEDLFMNTSCRYLVHEKSFGCSWIYLNNVKAKMINSFIFTQSREISHCPSIFNPLEKFNVIIKSKDVISKTEIYSEVYPVSMETITQAPRPMITSVKATDTSLNITWKSQWTSRECKIHYRQSTMKLWTEEKDSGFFHVIVGLQAFSQYRLTVACIGNYGQWSDWSDELQAVTLEGVPTAPPEVSYCVEPLDYSFRKILLVWKALEITEARGDILGYEVTYKSTNQTSVRRINTTDLKTELEVDTGDCIITLMAYNSAGHSPVRHININTHYYKCLPRVKGLWVSSDAETLRIRWQVDEAAEGVSEFAIEWFSVGDDKQWKRVNSSTISTVLTGIKQLQTYNINVYPIYDDLCGPPESIQASLESGTLLDIDQLQLVNKTKTSLTVQWMWLKKAPKTNVLQYRLEVRSAHETRSLIIFPDQWRHSFYRLQTGVEHSVTIYGETKTGTFSKANINISTPLLETDEIVTAAVPIILLFIGFVIFSVLSRTVYKDYFFPYIANPGHSLTGRWLLNPPQQGEAIMSVQKLDDLFLTSQVIEKCLIQMEHHKSSEKEDSNEDLTFLPEDCSTGTSDSVENSQASPALTEYVDLPFPDHFGYVENGHIPNTS